MIHNPEGRITLRRNPQRVRILAGRRVIADTRDAVELRETGYPPRQYIPREDIDLSRLEASASATYCPFKGDASYYSLKLEGETKSDAAWSYEAPFEAVARIEGLLSFDPATVEERIEINDTA